MKACVKCKIEIWCMDLAYVDKLTKSINGVKYHLDCQDLFDRTVDSIGRKTKVSKETVRAFLTVMITKLNWPNKVWVYKGTEFAEEFKKNRQSWRKTNLLYSEWNQGCIYWTYKTTTEKYNLPSHGRWRTQYVHNMTQFVTALKSGRNCSIDLMPKNVKNFDFSSILHSKPVREFGKPTFKISHRVRISKYDWPFRTGYKLQYTKEVFEIVALYSRKFPTYTIMDEQDETIHGNFRQKELVKII